MSNVNLEAYHALHNLALEYDATVVAVSKKKSIEDILKLYEAGHRDFGENYVQELTEKRKELPQDIRWHFVGHLQRNKVKQVVPFVHLIHGVDSVRLLEAINKRGQEMGEIQNVLLQVHIADEKTKFGFYPQELLDLMEHSAIHRLAWVRLSGVMGMATNTEDQDQIRREFTALHELYETIKERYYDRRPEWNTISMGMTGDYRIALECGSNMLRVGSLIFGPREY